MEESFFDATTDYTNGLTTRKDFHTAMTEERAIDKNDELIHSWLKPTCATNRNTDGRENVWHFCTTVEEEVSNSEGEGQLYWMGPKWTDFLTPLPTTQMISPHEKTFTLR